MRPRTLAARFLLLVFAGAVVPMVLVGLWLTQVSARAGRELLMSQLMVSADALDTAITREWSTRDGELQLLANNSAALHVVSGDVSALDSDTAYLAQLTGSLRRGIGSVTYYDAAGRSRWSARMSSISPRSQSETNLPSADVRVVVPVPTSGPRVGSVHVAVRLEGFIPSTASVRRLAGSASLIVADSSQAIWSEVPNPDSLIGPRPSEEWAVVQRALPMAGLRLLVVAPVAPYVTPFRSAARDGTIALLTAALAALVVGAIMSRRLVASLTTLADAADQVSSGALDATVTVSGSDEIVRLGTAFNTMTQSLRQSLAELSRQRSLAAVGEFAASLSHDVRNSLTAVRVDLQHAIRHLPEDAQGTALVRLALDSVRRLDATVTGALKVVRGEREMALVHVNDVVQRAIQAARPAFVDRSILLCYESSRSAITVRGDEGALEQMLLNLLLNAAEAGDMASEVSVHVTTSPHAAEIVITDHGAGIAATMLPALGTPLQSTKAHGTGLGLSIARRIATSHGGALQIESQEGAGTTVTVSLPLA